MKTFFNFLKLKLIEIGIISFIILGLVAVFSSSISTYIVHILVYAWYALLAGTIGSSIFYVFKNIYKWIDITFNDFHVATKIIFLIYSPFIILFEIEVVFAILVGLGFLNEWIGYQFGIFSELTTFTKSHISLYIIYGFFFGIIDFILIAIMFYWLKLNYLVVKYKEYHPFESYKYIFSEMFPLTFTYKTESCLARIEEMTVNEVLEHGDFIDSYIVDESQTVSNAGYAGIYKYNNHYYKVITWNHAAEYYYPGQTTIHEIEYNN